MFMRIGGPELIWPAVVVEDVGSGLPTGGRTPRQVSDGPSIMGVVTYCVLCV